MSFNDRKNVDSDSIQEMGDELCSLVDKENIKHILLNFAGVEFLSSAALNILILLDKKVKKVGGDLRLGNLRAEILNVFAITRLDRVFNITRLNIGDDDDLEAWGAQVPKPTPPDKLDGRAEPPSS